MMLKLITIILPTVVLSNFVTRKGSKLFYQEDIFTFSGVNIYWLGQDENNPDVPGGQAPFYSHPSMFR